MGIYKLLLPKMGESVNEATLTKWLKEVGDAVNEDDAVVEVATDKVDSDVPSPVSGVLKEKLFEDDQVVQVGEAIAIIETISEHELDSDGDSEEYVAPEEIELESEIPGLSNLNTEEESVDANESPDSESSDRFYSPLVRSIAQQEGLSLSDLGKIKGTGAEGRVTKEDVLVFLNKSEGQTNMQRTVSTQHEGSNIEVEPKVESPSNSESIPTPPVNVVKSVHGDEIVEMDRMRRMIADHMVHSVKTSPHVFSVVEADVTNLVRWRNAVKDEYKKREGENITFTPLIIEAISRALKDFPMVNVSVDGYNIIKRKHVNIGMATALPSGNLIVPVIKDADQLSLVGISKSVNDLANRARTNALRPDDTQGGTFTFTNIGAFGNIFGMPIINQPQAAILAVGTIKKKPAVIETPDGDMIGVRHFMYLTMSYDHRVIDGALGGTFVKRVSDYLENWEMDRKV